MPQSDFPAGGRRPVVIGGVSDAPTSVLIGQVVLNTSVIVPGIVRRMCIHFLTGMAPITGRTSTEHWTDFIDHPTMLGQ